MTSADAALRYDRSADLEGEDSLSAIARLIGPGATVLDLGAATGKLGLYLRDHKSCVVDGVELDAKAAALARPNYRKLLELNLEDVRLTEHFPRGAYDAIVCADVLEHLRDPGRILDQLPELLASNGRAFLSIPNVAYAGVVAGLLSGEFRYGPTGLLDETHLRFFTRSSIADLLAKHGFHAASMQPLYLPLQRSEFRSTCSKRFLHRCCAQSSRSPTRSRISSSSRRYLVPAPRRKPKPAVQGHASASSSIGQSRGSSKKQTAPSHLESWARILSESSFRSRRCLRPRRRSGSTSAIGRATCACGRSRCTIRTACCCGHGMATSPRCATRGRYTCWRRARSVERCSARGRTRQSSCPSRCRH